MSLKLIYVQYVLETLLFVGVIQLAFSGAIEKREPRKVLALFSGLNVLRFGGAAAALAALGRSGAPFLVQVAVGDFLTALLAVVSLILLLRRASGAVFAVTLMNVVGLLDILVSEGWIGYLELRGTVARGSFLHGPTIGAALYTALHLYSFHLIARAGSVRTPAPA